MVKSLSLTRTKNKLKVKFIAVSFQKVQNYKNQKNFENFEKSQGKNERTCQHMHVQNHAYANKSRCTNVRDVHQLLKPVLGSDITQHTDFISL